MRVAEGAGSTAERRDLADRFVRRAGLARFTTIACALGLVLPAITGSRPVVALAGLTIALSGGLAAAACRHLRSLRPLCRPAQVTRLLVLSVLLVGLFGGYLIGTLRVASLTGGVLQAWVGESVRAEVCVTGQVRSSNGWQSAVAEVLSLHGSDGAGRGAVSSAVGESVLIEVAPGKTAGVSLAQGMIVSLDGVIEAPDGPTDSGFHQAKQLLHEGIEVVLRAKSSETIRVMGRRGGAAGWFDTVRSSAKEHLSRGPSAAVDEVLQGVIMGDKVGIDEGWLTSFRRAGTAHMLSVSGLHVGSLAAIVLGLTRLVRLARGLGFVLAATAALLMIPFVGPSPPVVRAATMICVVLAGRWFGRGRDQWQVLALAAVVVLAPNPFGVFDVGFQLSFTALVGLLALVGPLQKLLARLPAAIGSNLAVSVAASAGTAPVALLVFDQTSLVSPVANLLVVPTLPLVVGLGMASVFSGFLWPGFSTAFDTLAAVPIMWTVEVCRLMAVAPVLRAEDVGRAAFAVGLGALLLPVGLALAGRSVRTPLGLPLPFFRRAMARLRRRRPRSRARAVGLGATVVLLGLAAGAAVYPALAHGLGGLEMLARARAWPTQVEVRVMDVGQGNAVLIRTPERRALLFDGGPAGCGLAGQLRALGVRKLDVVVVSHPHADHFAGLLSELDGVEVKTLIDSVQVLASRTSSVAPGGLDGALGGATGAPSYAEGGEAADYLALRRGLAEDGSRHVLAGTGSTVRVDGVTVRFFAPQRPLVLVDGADPWAQRGRAPSGDDLNGSSLVAVVSIGSVDVLIPGDAEAEALQRYDLPQTELVVVPHHGSRGAVTERLLQKWGTQAAFISVGEANTFGHPHPQTLSLLERVVATSLRTDTAGWVSCRVNGDQAVITTERTPTR